MHNFAISPRVSRTIVWTIAAFFLIGLLVNVTEPRFFLLLASALLLAVLLWRAPHILFVLALAALPLGNVLPIALGKHLVIDVSATEALLLLVLLMVGVQALLGEREVRKVFAHDRIFWCLGAFLLLALLSYGYIVDAKLFFFSLRVLFFGLASYVLARLLFQNGVAYAWFFAGLSLAVMVLSLQVFLLMAEHGYSVAIFYDRNFLLLPIGAIAYASALLSLALPALTGYALSERGARRALSLIAIIFGFSALMLMLSKAAIGSLFLAVLVMLWKMRGRFFGAILSLFGGVLLFFFLFSPFLSALIERSLRAFVDANSQYRILEYKLAGTILHDHWLFGVGLGQQPLYFQKIYYADFLNFVNNYFLQGWLDLGLAGLAVLGLATYFAARLAFSIVRKTSTESRAPLAVGLLGSLVAAFFNGLAEVTLFGLFYLVLFLGLLGLLKNMELWKDSR